MHPRIVRRSAAIFTALIAVPVTSISAAGQTGGEDTAATIDARADRYGAIAKQIWDLAEVGYQEERSSELLRWELEESGFTVQNGVAGMPTAFVASYGSGEPVIAILAEFDALPGISQAAVPERQPLDQAAGHACGHHLFGTASTAAGIATREWLEATGTKGTVRVYGSPAEEGGAGKVYMARAGLFDDVDVVLHWHPGDRNDASPSASLANKSAKFRFAGLSSHAAASPERGRSALDGVEAMNHMVNLMREHIPQEARIHYVITHGGSAPNVVPDFAEVYYYVRHPDVATAVALFERVAQAAEGAALGTETTMEYEVIHGLYNLMPNETLAGVVYENLVTVGGFDYDAHEQAFAEEIRQTLGDVDLPLDSHALVQPFEMPTGFNGSTDVGDVSWLVPTAELSAATWVPGTSAHSWQAIAAGGTSIGTKGMLVAAKTLAATATQLFQSPQTITLATAELHGRRGADFMYQALVGDRKPPLDYRR